MVLCLQALDVDDSGAVSQMDSAINECRLGGPSGQAARSGGQSWAPCSTVATFPNLKVHPLF